MLTWVVLSPPVSTRVGRTIGIIRACPSVPVLGAFAGASPGMPGRTAAEEAADTPHRSYRNECDGVGGDTPVPHPVGTDADLSAEIGNTRAARSAHSTHTTPVYRSCHHPAYRCRRGWESRVGSSQGRAPASSSQRAALTAHGGWTQTCRRIARRHDRAPHHRGRQQPEAFFVLRSRKTPTSTGRGSGGG